MKATSIVGLELAAAISRIHSRLCNETKLDEVVIDDIHDSLAEYCDDFVTELEQEENQQDGNNE